LSHASTVRWDAHAPQLARTLDASDWIGLAGVYTSLAIFANEAQDEEPDALMPPDELGNVRLTLDVLSKLRNVAAAGDANRREAGHPMWQRYLDAGGAPVADPVQRRFFKRRG